MSTTRAAFVGSAAELALFAPAHPAGGLEPTLVAHGPGGDPERLRAALAALDADVVVVLAPHDVPSAALAGLRGVRLAFDAEPVLHQPGDADPAAAWPHTGLSRVDASAFDRVVAADPLLAAAARSHMPVWRSLPLPVADRFFATAAERSPMPRVLFVGRSTEHRERWLVPVKHRFDLLHAAHGLSADRLQDLLGRTDVAVNVHAHPGVGFEPRVPLHLAAGQLVVSAPLHPHHGLVPGVDYLEVADADQLQLVVGAVLDSPAAYRGMRLRGRRRAESFRASRVWPRLVEDLLRDVATFGPGR